MAFGAEVQVKTTVAKSNSNNFRNELQKFVDSATSSKPIVLKKIGLEMNKTQQTKLKNSIQSYLDSAGDDLTIKINKIDASEAVADLRTQLEAMLSGLKITGLKDFLGTDGVASTYERAAKAAEKAAAAQKRTRQADGSAQVIQGLQRSVNSAYSRGSKLTDSVQTERVLADYQNICELIQRAKTLQGDEKQTAITSIAEKTAALRSYIDAQLESVAAAKKAAAEEAKGAEAANATAAQIKTLYDKVVRYERNNPKVMRNDYTANLISNIKSKLTTGGTLDSEELKQLNNDLATVATSAKALGVEGKTAFDSMVDAYKKFGGWTLITRSMTFAIQRLKEMIRNVVNLDAAMTELKKVTNLSDEAYNKFFDNAIQRAKKLGATVSDTITASADFARLGYSVDEAEKLADAAIVYKNVGDGIEDISEASESIISTMKAFGDETMSAMDIVDKFNEIGNNFAISSEGVGEAMKRSASALAAAGNTIDESIALAVGMNAVLQDCEKVGTVLKTSSMYLRAAKTDLEEAGESTDGMAKSVSELRKELLQLTNNKVDIMVNDTTFKSTIQIYRELAAVWDSLSDVDAANILELIGGKRNATANASLMTNFDDVEAALSSSADSAGSALAENEKYLDSINGRIEELKASFESLSAHVVGSDIVKMVVELARGLVNLLDLLGQAKMILPIIAVSIRTIVASRNALQLEKSKEFVKGIVSVITQEKTVTDTLATSILVLTQREKALMLEKLNEQVVNGNINQQLRDQIVNTYNLAAAQKTQQGIGSKIGSVLTSLKSWTNAFTLLGGIAAQIALPWIIDKIKKQYKSLEELNEEWDRLSGEIEQSANSFRQLKSSADETIPRFAQLAKGVDQFGNNVSLTDEEYAEFLRLNNKIAELFPELNLGMDSSGNAMLALSYSADTLTDSLNSLVEAQRNATSQEIADKMPDELDNVTKTVDKYEKEIEKKKKALEDWNKFSTTSSSEVKDVSKFADMASFFDARQGEYDRAVSFAESIGISEDKATGMIRRVGDDNNWYYDWSELLNSDEVKNALAGIEREIDAFEGRITAKWNQLRPVVTAWMQTDYLYQDLDSDMQSVVSKMISKVDFNSLDIDSADDIKDYISDAIINPIHDATPEAQKALTDMLTLNKRLSNGNITKERYDEIVDGLLYTLKNSDFDLGTIDLLGKLFDSESYKASLPELEKQLKEYKANLANEYSKISDWGLDDYAGSIKSHTVQTVFGNVDMDKRAIIEWSSVLKDTYKKELESWDYDPEIGTVDTVFGGSDNFGKDLNGVGWEIAFTPILPDGTFLSQETVSEYINKILTEAYGSDGKVTEEELAKIDAEGRQVGDTFVHGIFAAVSDGNEANGGWADTVGKLMHFSGGFGAISLAEKGIRQTEQSISSVKDTTDKTVVSLKDLKEASSGIASLASSYDELFDEDGQGQITLKTISEICEALELSGDELAKYKNILLSAKEGDKEYMDALSELTYKMVEKALGTEGLKNATEAEIEAVLRENEVSNSAAVAHEMVTQAKIKEKLATYDGTDASYENIKAYFEETLSAEDAATALAQLTIAKILFNDNELNTQKDIEQIINYAETARLSVKSLADFKRAKEELDDSFVGAVSPTTQSIIDGTYVPEYNDKRLSTIYTSENLKKRKEKAEKLRQDAIKKKKDFNKKVSDIDKDLAKKEKQFAEDMNEAWEKEHLEQLKDNLKKYENIIDQYKEKIDITDTGLEWLEPDDFVTKSDLLTTKLGQVTDYGRAMREEFDRLCSITPQTGDEAEELASRIQTLGSNMRDNVSTLRETQVAIQRLRIDAMSSILDSGMGQLEAELDRIDRRLKILNSDTSEDYAYVRKALDMDMQLPLMSDFRTQRDAKSRENRALISAEQEKQDKINAIVTRSLEMQAAANAAARAKERQQLIEDMEEARADAAEKLQEATEDYIEFLKENKLYTKATAEEIEKIIKQTDLTFPEPDISGVTSAFDNIKQGIQDIADTIDGLDINIQGTASITTGAGMGGGGGGIPSGRIPVGSAVYFQSSDPSGHVGIMGADGYIYHDEGGKISRNTLDEMAKKGYTYRGHGWNGGTALSEEEAAKVAAVAQNSIAYGVIPKNKMCQAWVADVYATGTGKPRISAPTATEAWERWGQTVLSSTGSSLGFISSKYEGGTVGAISHTPGDYGGTSYGIPQFTTKDGNANSFVAWLKQYYPEIGNGFGKASAGSPEFDAAWKIAAGKYPELFEKAQNEYGFQTMVNPIRQRIIDKYGLDMNRSTALREALISAAYQYNNITIRDGSTGLLYGYKPGMSDREIIDLIYGNKAKNVNSHFKSSSSKIRESIRNRIKNEWKEVLGLLSYASGTDGHPGGLALVGDENFLKGSNTPSPELISYPDGTVEIAGKTGAEIRNLPKGTAVLPANDTKKLINRIPSYATGIKRGNLDDEGVRNFLNALDSGWTTVIGGSLKSGDYLIKASEYWTSPEYYDSKAWEERTVSDKYKEAYDREYLTSTLTSAVEAGYTKAIYPYAKEMRGYWDDLQPQVNEIKQYIKENGLDKAQEKYGKLILTGTNISGNIYGKNGTLADTDWNYVTQDMLYKAHTSNYDYMMTEEIHQKLAQAMLDYSYLKKIALFSNSENYQAIMELDKLGKRWDKVNTSATKTVIDNPEQWELDYYGNDAYNRHSHQEKINPYSLFDKAIVSYFSELEMHKAENPDKILKIEEQLEFNKEHSDFLTSQQVKRLEDEKARLEKEMVADANVISDSIKDLNPFAFILANSDLGKKYWNFDNNSGNPFDESYRYGSNATYVNGKRVETKEHSKGILDALLHNKNYQQSIFNGFDENGNFDENYVGSLTKLESGLVRNADGTYTYTSPALDGLSITWDKDGKFSAIKTLNDGSELKISDFINNYSDVVNSVSDYIPKIITDDLNQMAVDEFNNNTRYGAELSPEEKADKLSEMGLADNSSGTTSLGGNGKISAADMLPIQELISQLEAAWDRISSKSRTLALDIESDWRLSEEQKDLAQFRVVQDIHKEGSETLLKMKEQAIAALLNYQQSGGYDKEVLDAYYDLIDDIDDKLMSLADDVSSKRQAFITKMENDISAIEDFISTRNTYNDWASRGTSELKELRKELDIIRTYNLSDILVGEEYFDKVNELQQKTYTTGINLITTAVNDELDEYVDSINDKIDKKNFAKSQYDALHTLGQAYYDVINNVRDSYHDINKELKASKTMYEYLNEESRELLFNQKDYNVLSTELSSIKEKAVTLQSNYMRAIRNADKESIDGITSSYQRQYEVLMKNYEIAKADLEVAKKKQQLDNVLNERNVSMFIDGEWRWVANSQNVIDAQNELEDAKYAQEQANDTLNQTLNLNSFQSASDGLTTQVNYLNTDIENARDAWDDIQKQIKGQSQTLASVLEDIANSDCPQLQNIISTSGTAIVDFYNKITGKTLELPKANKRNYVPDVDYKSLIIYTAKSEEQAKEYNDLRNQKIKGEGRSEGMMTNEEAVQLWKQSEEDRKNRAKVNGYATGTRNAKKGLAEVGEAGDETLITNKGRYVPITEPIFTQMFGGEVVFNSEQMGNLRTLYDLSKSLTSGLGSLPVPGIQNQSTQIDNSVTINGMTIERESNGELLNQLRRLRAIG